VLLETLISEVGRMSVLFSRRPSPFFGKLLALPFYRLKGRIRLTTNPRRCLGGEGGASTVGVAVATFHILMTGRRDIRGAIEDVRFPVVDVRVVVSLFD
jgi:hypothetical protein